MGKLFYEEDTIYVRDISDVNKYIWTPLAEVLGEWRMAANSVDPVYRRNAVERYPILMAEVSRYKTSLEISLEYGRDEEYQLYVKECLEQIDKQLITVSHIRGQTVARN